MLELLSCFKPVGICHLRPIDFIHIWEPVNYEGPHKGGVWNFIILNSETIEGCEDF